MGIFSKNPRISFPVNMSPKVNVILIDSNISGQCKGFPEYLDSDLSVTETFPVPTGTVLDVTLGCTDNTLAVGDKTITCYGGSHFYYSKTPVCLSQGITKLI